MRLSEPSRRAPNGASLKHFFLLKLALLSSSRLGSARNKHCEQHADICPVLRTETWPYREWLVMRFPVTITIDRLGSARLSSEKMACESCLPDDIMKSTVKPVDYQHLEFSWLFCIERQLISTITWFLYYEATTLAKLAFSIVWWISYEFAQFEP